MGRCSGGVEVKFALSSALLLIADRSSARLRRQLNLFAREARQHPFD
jgi:hypothetical protein